MCYRRAPLSGSKVSLVAERFTVLRCHSHFFDFAPFGYCLPGGCFSRGATTCTTIWGSRFGWETKDHFGITAIFKDFAVYLVVIISVTLPVAFAVILPDETYYLEEMHQPPTNAGALPLQEYRRDVPPGWNPGDPAYPLKTYFEKLRLWYRVCSVEDELVGPLIAGRLYGRAAKIAMSLRVPRPDGTYMTSETQPW